MKYRTFAFSVQGESHIRLGKCCQDYSYSYSDEKYSVISVCDGHGGRDYVRSEIGSEIACKTAAENIKAFIENADIQKLKTNPDEMLTKLEASIINDWNEKVNEHYRNNPFTENELFLVSEDARTDYENEIEIESAYGTTLLAAAVTKDYWFAIQIGDGSCTLIEEDGKFISPVPDDENCYMNITTSMCDSDALSCFRHYFSEAQPLAVFLCTDGVDNSFDEKENENAFFQVIVNSYAGMSEKTAEKELSDFLPKLSAKGSCDDISLAAFIDKYKTKAMAMSETGSSDQ